MNGSQLFDPVTDATVSEVERRELVARHHRATTTVLHLPTGGITEITTEPFCPQCGEPWGDNGCPTVRAVAMLYQVERAAREAREREYAMRKELAALAVRGEWWKDRSAHTLNASVVISGDAIAAAGMAMIAHALRDLHKRIEREAFPAPAAPEKASVENSPAEKTSEPVVEKKGEGA